MASQNGDEQMDSKRRILVTSALPYANGNIHLGHLVEYLQTDIWVRFQKARGHECRYMCADDTHGTPIMISARQQGITPEELVGRMHERHSRDFADFLIEFDNYYTTNSPENREFAELIYTRLRDKGHIAERTIEQAYCPEDKMFLPDRMIRGTCPRCGAEDQYGDSCEACSATYAPTDLKAAACSICGTPPQRKSSSHFFFKLGDFQDQLRTWIEGDHVQEQMRKKLLEWFEDGLKDWDISRDAPYFGFKIPGTEDKYFYVWLDAPIGYMAATRNWAEREGKNFDDYWLSDQAEIVHFIGKDIVYFHTLFWPAMLMGSGFRAPDKVYVHGFLTVNGQKMSKSRGTFIPARAYLDHLDPEYLRYYYACKLTSRVEDIDLNLMDFVARVNADVGNQFINLGSRVINFLHKRLEGRLGTLDAAGIELLEAIEAGAVEIAEFYEGREYSRAMKEITALAHKANQFVADTAPWALIKGDAEAARSALTAAVNAFAKISVMLQPVLPKLTAGVDAILGRERPDWSAVSHRLENVAINPFEPLFVKVTDEMVEKLVEALVENQVPGTETVAEDIEVPELAEQISFDDFAKIDLRVAKVLEAESVPKASKLLKLRVSLGKLGERTIFAGIKKTHDPEKLVGKTLIVVANLAPRQMKFGLSEGMLVAAAGTDSDGLFLSALEPGAKPGMKIS
jgi:methionyl-tRNA synthetase